jgi:hypothetical protein
MTRFFRVNRDNKVPTKEDQSNHHRSMKTNATYLSAIQVRRHFWVDQIVGDVRWPRIQIPFLYFFCRIDLSVSLLWTTAARQEVVAWVTISVKKIGTDLIFLTEPCCLCYRAIRRATFWNVRLLACLRTSLLWPVRNRVLPMSSLQE